jgi:hypothetical protein
MKSKNSSSPSSLAAMRKTLSKLLSVEVVEAVFSKALQNALAIVEGIRRDRARGYIAFGTAALLQDDRSPELLISGPAGTGKSRAVLELINFLMWQYAGARTLIVRKTRKSLNESGLFTLEKYVLGMDNPMVVNGPSRAHRDTARRSC